MTKRKSICLNVYEAVRHRGEWITAKEIAAYTEDVVSVRTARKQAAHLADYGVFKVEKRPKGYRYRMNDAMPPDAASLVACIEARKAVFELSSGQHHIH